MQSTNLGPFRVVGSGILPRDSILLPPERADGSVGVLIEFEPLLRVALTPPLVLLLVLFVVLSVVGSVPVVLPAFASPPGGRDRGGPRGHGGRGARRRVRRDAGRYCAGCGGVAGREIRSCRRRRHRCRCRAVRRARRFLPGDAVRELLLDDLDLDFVGPQTTRLLLLLLVVAVILYRGLQVVVVLQGMPLQAFLLDQARRPRRCCRRGRRRCR